MMQLSERLEQYRVRTGEYATTAGTRYGAFVLPGPAGRELTILAADGAETGWEHVSVSTPRHPPNWTEMCVVKDLFWPPEDVVVQYHPARSAYIDNHPHCLHLWRWTRGDFPTPPSVLVGYKDLDLAT